MNRSDIFSLNQIRDWLKVHQKRLVAGDDLPSFSEVCRRANIHKDTGYTLCRGDRIDVKSQWGLSRAIKEIEAETSMIAKSRILSIKVCDGRPLIQFGLSTEKILKVKQ